MSDPNGPAPRRPAPPTPPDEAGVWVTLGLLVYPLVVWGLAVRFELPPIDAVFLGALVVVLPTLAVAQIPLTTDARVERIPAYVASGVTVALLGAAAAGLGYRRGGWEGLGLAAYPLKNWAIWSAAVLFAGSLLIVALHLVRKRLGVLESPILLELMPRTGREKLVFVGLSFCAGFGEEIAFRGYAVSALAPFLGGGWGAALFTSAVFGLLHAYQGPLGMARSTLLGFLLASSFLATGSLWPAITAHVALDLLGGLVWGDRLTQ